MTSIYVRGFPRRTGERDLEKLFQTYGSVNDVRMVRDFAFVVLPPHPDLQGQGVRIISSHQNEWRKL